MASCYDSAVQRAPSTLRNFASLDRRIWVIATVRAANTMGLSLVLSFFGVYVVSERGESALFYGTLMMGAYIVQSVAQAYAGELSDRMGRINIMAAALWTRALVLAVLGVLIEADTSIYWMMPTIIASNILRGFFEPVSYAMVSDIADDSQRVAALSLQRIGTNLGWAIGPVTGGLLSQVLPFGQIFYVAAPVLLLSGFLISRLAEPDRHAAEGRSGVFEAWRAAARDRAGLGLLLCAALFTLGHGQIFTTLSIHMTDRLDLTKAHVGALFAVNAALVLLLQIAVVAWIRRSGYRKALIAGSAFLTLALASCGLFDTLRGLVLSMALYTLGEVLVAPSQQALAAELSGAGRMGRAFGLLGQAQMLGVAFAPLFGGAVYDSVPDNGALWAILAGIPLAMTLGYLRLAGVTSGKSAPR
jgi:MFS family permease